MLYFGEFSILYYIKLYRFSFNSKAKRWQDMIFRPRIQHPRIQRVQFVIFLFVSTLNYPAVIHIVMNVWQVGKSNMHLEKTNANNHKSKFFHYFFIILFYYLFIMGILEILNFDNIYKCESGKIRSAKCFI